MVYPKNNSIIFWFFRRYVLRLVNKNFDELRFNNIKTSNDRSILLIANHYSYWDSLLLFYVNEKLFKKKLYIMILEETFRREPFVKYAGAFSVNKNSRDILQSLDFAAHLLEDPGNLVLIFPQGKLYPNFVSHINFEKGVERIIKQVQGKFQTVFAAAFIQYFKSAKPVATVYLQVAGAANAAAGIKELQSAYQQHFDRSKNLQTEADIET